MNKSVLIEALAACAELSKATALCLCAAKKKTNDDVLLGRMLASHASESIAIFSATNSPS